MNLEKCPSIWCKYKKDMKLTPDQIIEHLDELGIEPFFTGTLNIRGEPKSISKLIPKNSINLQPSKIFSVAECVACCDNKSTIICVPCGHCVLCPECAQMFKKNSCPLCNGYYNYLVPL